MTRPRGLASALLLAHVSSTKLAPIQISHSFYPLIVDYFLVVADIVRRRPIHCGRGSAAASLVSYLLGITHVDPIRHNLLFGRFLNPQRKDPPDIDVDFPWDERDALHEELRQYYGTERLATVANHVGFGARAAVRDARSPA